VVKQAELADRLSRTRVRILTALMIVFAVNQAMIVVDQPTRTVELVSLYSWLFMAFALLMVLRSGGLYLREPSLRALADDEVTRANRAEATDWGFSAAMIFAICLSVIASLTAMPVLFALKMVLLAGLFTATFRFVALERKALA
jgi:hypothetical protein